MLNVFAAGFCVFAAGFCFGMVIALIAEERYKAALFVAMLGLINLAMFVLLK